MVRLKSLVLLGFIINLLFTNAVGKPSQRINKTETISAHVVGVKMTRMVAAVEEDHKIIFPQESGEVNLVTRTISNNNKEVKCTNNICEDVDNYPSSLVLEIVKKETKLHSYFKESAFIEIGNRNMIDEDRTVCSSIQKPEFPKAAINLNKTMRLIVNEGPYQQGFITETCSKGANCFLGESSFPNDYEWGCKQRYSIRRLVTLTEDNQTDFDSFEFPSCCVCTYRRKN